MSDLQRQFEEMLEKVRNATIDFKPNNSQKLKLYAFYKQATQGDVTGECPSIVNMVERAKYQAWKAIKGKSKEDAMAGYLKVFEENN
jgi:3-hydroxyacyl-CoA dehydrogenase